MAIEAGMQGQQFPSIWTEVGTEVCTTGTSYVTACILLAFDGSYVCYLFATVLAQDASSAMQSC